MLKSVRKECLKSMPRWALKRSQPALSSFNAVLLKWET